MFPDSDSAHSFACGSDKMAYISKFGIAPYISERLVADANKDAFVLMFDESLNWICTSAIGARITSSPDMRYRSSWDVEQQRIYYAISK